MTTQTHEQYRTNATRKLTTKLKMCEDETANWWSMTTFDRKLIKLKIPFKWYCTTWRHRPLSQDGLELISFILTPKNIRLL